MQITEEFVGGSPWINLANTVRFVEGVRVDRLEEAETLVPFLLGNGLCAEEQVIASQNPEQQGELVRKLQQLRSVFAQVLAQFDTEGRVEEEAAKELAHFVNELQVAYVCAWGDQEQRYVFRWRGRTLVDEVLLQLIDSCTETLANVSPDRIRQCEHEQCVLHFVDTSKAGKRRWCSMTTCGNRSKAAQYYSKHKRKIGGE